MTGEQEIAEKPSTQATPFNITSFELLTIFCVIISLTSSLYHNWPAIERILVDDRVFKDLCTKQEIENALPGMFVCDAQMRAIANLAIVIHYSEFIAFAIGGPLTDHFGIYTVLIMGYMFGILSLMTMYYSHWNVMVLKMAFGFWGFFGGFVFITSIHLARMFPESTSLADGMIIFFDNLSCVMPLVIHKIMKYFKLRFYEAFGSYLLWGVFPSLFLTICFIPKKIAPTKTQGNETYVTGTDTSSIHGELNKFELWMNLIIFSIPVTCTIYYKKAFSSHYYNNQALIKIFPYLLLFLSLPTPFITVLNQFIGVHLTSSFLYVLYIISFFFLLKPTKVKGLISIILFTIGSSTVEQQTMSYISENHSTHESTLMGISYFVKFVIGSFLQYLLAFIHDRISPKASVYLIAILFLISIGYSIFCHFQSVCQLKHESASATLRVLYIILWFIPFVFLCVVLIFNSHDRKKPNKIEQFRAMIPKLWNYYEQKNVSITALFYAISLYYVSNVMIVMVSIFRVTDKIPFEKDRFLGLLMCFSCFFILPYTVVSYYFLVNKRRYFNITLFISGLLVFKVALYHLSNIAYPRLWIFAYTLFLFVYGCTFLIFTNMLVYYNHQIAYFERSYRTSLIHWGSLLTVFMVFRFFHNAIMRFKNGYTILWVYCSVLFLFFATLLYFYFPYEMDIPFTFKAINLPFPSFAQFNVNNIESGHHFYTRIISLSLITLNLAVMFNLKLDKKFCASMLSVSFVDISGISFAAFSNVSDLIGLFKYSDLLMTSASAIFCFCLLLAKIFYKDLNLQKNRFSIAFMALNFLTLSVSSNYSALRSQYDLQSCCCAAESSKCLTCQNCCCESKGKKPRCTKSIYDADPCQCKKDKCSKCVCTCDKKIRRPTKAEPRIIFAFFEKDCNTVQLNYCTFYMGSFFGWILMLIYIAAARGNFVTISTDT